METTDRTAYLTGDRIGYHVCDVTDSLKDIEETNSGRRHQARVVAVILEITEDYDGEG